MRAALMAAGVVLAAVPSLIAPAPQLSPSARGRRIFTASCAPCHGPDGRGGVEGATDLTRSPILRADDGGKQLAAFLKVGRPERRMPPVPVSDTDAADLYAFIRSVAAGPAAARGGGASHGAITAVVVGDAAAGEARFNGAGGCRECHSASGDFKSIGARLTPAAIQGRLVLPRGNGGYPPSFNSPPDPRDPARTVTVTQASGDAISGTLMWITDFSVTLRDASGTLRSFARDGDVPKVEVKDPAQWHLDHLRTLTDKDMHDLTAYLVTLK
jgi:cytochrome c oxidase cbb3-type subunit III